MSVAGDTFVKSARILAVVWEGVTSSGHSIELRDPVTSIVLWAARTSDTQTYLGINLGIEGLPCPNGFKLQQISAGRLFVYLREN
jgi:hypothetical protein